MPTWIAAVTADRYTPGPTDAERAQRLARHLVRADRRVVELTRLVFAIGHHLTDASEALTQAAERRAGRERRWREWNELIDAELARRERHELALRLAGWLEE